MFIIRKIRPNIMTEIAYLTLGTPRFLCASAILWVSSSLASDMNLLRQKEQLEEEEESVPRSR